MRDFWPARVAPTTRESSLDERSERTPPENASISTDGTRTYLAPRGFVPERRGSCVGVATAGEAVCDAGLGATGAGSACGTAREEESFVVVEGRGAAPFDRGASSISAPSPGKVAGSKAGACVAGSAETESSSGAGPTTASMPPWDGVGSSAFSSTGGETGASGGETTSGEEGGETLGAPPRGASG